MGGNAAAGGRDACAEGRRVPPRRRGYKAEFKFGGVELVGCGISGSAGGDGGIFAAQRHDYGVDAQAGRSAWAGDVGGDGGGDAIWGLVMAEVEAGMWDTSLHAALDDCWRIPWPSPHCPD